MSTNIQLVRSSLPAQLDNQHTWPLEVTSVSLGAMPSEIFVYHKGQAGVTAAYAGDVFECVASVHQLSEIGLAPSLLPDGKEVPYYRSAVLKFDCRSAEEADDLWNKIIEDTVDLVNNYLAAADLVVSSTINI